MLRCFMRERPVFMLLAFCFDGILFSRAASGGGLGSQEANPGGPEARLRCEALSKVHFIWNSMVDAKPPQARAESEDLSLGPMPDGLREVKVKLPAKQVLHL